MVIGALASVAHATPALDKAPFTATPAELLAAAKAAPRGSAELVVLREEYDVAYDDRGRVTARWRFVFTPLTQDAVDEWSTVSWAWQPSYQDKPIVRARVIDPSGRVQDLDPKLMTDAPASESVRAAADDQRSLNAPLPHFTAGAVVEQEITIVDREPLIGGGASYRVSLSPSGPTQSMRVTFSSPASTKLRVVAHGIGGAKPKTTTAGGRNVTSYALGPLAPNESYEWNLPIDARPYPYIIATPVTSWSAVARGYRKLVDSQIAAGPVTWPAELPKSASLDTVRAILAWRAQHVQYNGAGVRETSLVPTPPAEIVKRGHANALDAATLVVALLRQAGIAADLVLLDSGAGPGLDADIAALNLFDTALVRAHIGKADVWIEPVDELGFPGRLTSWHQGRQALVVADATTKLVITPVTPATENLVREVRTFEIAEAGYAKVTEVSREGGSFDSEQRSWLRRAAPDAVRKQLSSYVDSQFGATLDSYSTTAPDDFAKPFELTLVASQTKRAWSDREYIEVYVWPTDVLGKLPQPLRNPTEDAPARKLDFQLETPHVYEVENRLVVPAGFTITKPAADRTRELGPFKLVEKQRVDGQTFVVTFRFEAAKLRLTPAEVTAMQKAVRALRQEDAMRIVFPLAASTLAGKGKYKEAIAEAQRLIQLHPKEALHHQQLARVLVEAGAGAAARREARKATELEPKNADPYVTLAWILRHDTLGQWLGFDHDHAGAVAALRKATKLDPKHVGAVHMLAETLEYNAHGRRFERGADLRGAIEAWRATRALDDSSDNAYSLAFVLAWAGEHREAEQVLRTMRSEDRRDQLLVAMIALNTGTDAAIRFAGTLGSTSKKARDLGMAGALLMLLRQYDPMRALFAEANQMQAGSPQALFAQKVSRADKPFKPLNDPRDVALSMTLAQLHGDRKPAMYWDGVTRDELHERTRADVRIALRTALMTVPLVEDVMRSGAVLTVEGDAGLWRVDHELYGNRSQTYLAASRGTPKVIATSEQPRGAGRHVLRLLAKNDEAGAQRLLDWLVRDLAARAGTDQLSFELLRLWGDKLPRTRAAMEVAGALLAGKSDAARAVPILAKCKPTTTDGQLACDWELSNLYSDGARWVELVDHARDWATRAPKQIDGPLLAQAFGLAKLGKLDDADRLVAEAIAQDADNRMLLISYADIAIARGRLAEAVRRLEPLVTKPDAQPTDLNNLAWLKLFEGGDLTGAATLAKKSLQQTPKSGSVLNTLAAIEAELGDLGDARHHLVDSIDVKKQDRPVDADLYVHARILEQLGFTDDAIAIYRQLKPQTSASFLPDAADFAARRLKVLGVKQ